MIFNGLMGCLVSETGDLWPFKKSCVLHKVLSTLLDPDKLPNSSSQSVRRRSYGLKIVVCLAVLHRIQIVFDLGGMCSGF